MRRMFAFLFILLLSAPLQAAGSIVIDEVVVTATRTEEEIDKIPSSITVITQERIRNSQAKTVQDLLRLEEGLIVKDLYGQGTKSSVDMRGFDRGINTAVLIDGVRVNEIDLSGVDWNLIPIEKIERIEIVRGSGSVLYGDNALAGVINIITKKGEAGKPSVEVGVRGESYGGHREHISFQAGAERVSFFGLLKNRWTNGYRKNSEFDAQDAHGNFSISLTESLMADIRLGYHTDHQGYPGSLTAEQIRADRRQSTEPRNGADYEQYFYGLNLIYAKPWGDIEAAYHFNSREFDSMYVGTFFGSPYSYDAIRDTDSQEMKLKAVLKQPVLGFANKLIFGIDYFAADVGQESAYEDPSFTDITKASIEKRETGIYVEDEFFLSNRWSIIAGYRHTYAKITDRSSSSSAFLGFPFSGSDRGVTSFTEDSYKAGIAFNYQNGAKIFANYSKGFRLPTTDELFSFDGRNVVIAHLKPEKADTYELGIVHPFAEKIIGRLTIYRMDVKDELFFNPTCSSCLFGGANENIDKSLHQGFEFGVSAAVTDSLSVFGNWTYSEVTFESGPYEGKTIPLRPRNTVNIGADIRLVDTLMLGLQAHWVDERRLDNDVQNRLKQIDDYLTVDARLSYKYRMVTAYAGVNNIFNEKYYASGSSNTAGLIKYLPAPERNFYAGITFNF